MQCLCIALANDGSATKSGQLPLEPRFVEGVRFVVGRRQFHSEYDAGADEQRGGDVRRSLLLLGDSKFAVQERRSLPAAGTTSRKTP